MSTWPFPFPDPQNSSCDFPSKANWQGFQWIICKWSSDNLTTFPYWKSTDNTQKCTYRTETHPWLTRHWRKPQGRKLLSEDSSVCYRPDTDTRGGERQPSESTAASSAGGRPTCQVAALLGQPSSGGTTHKEQWPVHHGLEGRLVLTTWVDLAFLPKATREIPWEKGFLQIILHFRFLSMKKISWIPNNYFLLNILARSRYTKIPTLGY